MCHTKVLPTIICSLLMFVLNNHMFKYLEVFHNIDH